ncbi:MAG: SDR family NAD(P)-dependent oxidoreductase, partial [Dehalococcoidia bacterium]|nr:SDR family NAD(P)-dependent oxidoreductase [Dehalococcoidia bacterium]
MDQPLFGQVALVTGGAGLIGSAISRRLASLGATVVINGRDEAKAERLATELRAAGHTVVVHCANIREEAAVAAMVERVVGEHGRIDIVVNNAGGVSVAGASGAARVTELSLADWQAVLDLNLTGAFLVTRATLPLMQRRGYGRYVNISSAGYFGVMGLSNYAAAKRGL